MRNEAAADQSAADPEDKAAADQEDEAAADQADEEYEADNLYKSRQHQHAPLGRPAQERRGFQWGRSGSHTQTTTTYRQSVEKRRYNRRRCTTPCPNRSRSLINHRRCLHRHRWLSPSHLHLPLLLPPQDRFPPARSCRKKVSVQTHRECPRQTAPARQPLLAADSLGLHI